ncbi:MAG: outer membrane protein [Candidatus Acidoferrum typicum]|nr:outer membrane protein [Candidatus Acidoferrum typicum]
MLTCGALLDTSSRKRKWVSARRYVIWALLIALYATIAGAQQNQPTTYEGFEGRTVFKVDIAASPVMNVNAFRPLIKQKEREPFSMAAIRESVAALQKTALFSQVQVKVEPEQSGLHVTFLLQPAFYVGMVFFPGANAFSYTRMLQAVNIPDQTPFVDDLVTNGKGALLELFKNDGFFQAKIDAETQRDEKHLIVNLIYHCTLGPRAKIGEVTFQGASEKEKVELRAALTSFWAKLKGGSLRGGQPYTQTRLTKSLDYLRQRLEKSGHLTPIVRLAPPSYDAGTRHAHVTFEVQPGPLVSIQLNGAHVWKRTLKRLIPIYEENTVDRDLVEEGGRNLASYFQSKSYFDVKVDSHFDQKPDEIRVVYDVHKGDKHKVQEVHFEGNHYFSDQQLQAHILIKKARLLFVRGKISNELVRKSVASITNLYKNEGFEKAKVEPQVRDHEPQIDVTFRILEGDQERVNTLQIVDARNEPMKPPIKHPLNLAPGKPYSRKLLEDDRSQVLADYMDEGYLNAHFDPTATPASENPLLVNVFYKIDPGPLARVGEVALLGAEHTQPKFLRNITDPKVKEGQPLSEGKLLSSESDLYDLGIFDWATISPLRPIEGQEYEEVLIKVHESKRNVMDVGAGFEVVPRSGNVPVGAVALPGLPPVSLGSNFTTSQKSFFGPRFSFDYSRRDLRGRAETASIGVLYSRLDQRATATYSDPRFRGSTWASLLSLSAERTTENSIYTARLGQVSWQIEKALDSKRTKTLRLRYSFQRTNLSNITIPDLVLPQDQRVRLSTFSVEYVRDTRDQPLDAHHGIYQTASFGVTPTALGSSSNFTRFLGQTAFYRSIRPWLTWANNFRVGLASPFSGSFVPISERFFSGGADSLRGFPINGAGPQRPVTVCGNPSDPATCTLISVPVGGRMLAIVNSEGRFPIPLKSGLGGVVFYDGGNVYSAVNFRQLHNSYTNSIGFGIRYRTPVGPVRIDIGHNLNSPPGVKATQYFVTLGQAF